MEYLLNTFFCMESDEYQDQGWTEHMTKNRKRNLEKKKLMKKVEELQNEVKYLDRSGSANVNENDDGLKQMNNDTNFIEKDADTNRRPRSFKPATSLDDKIKLLQNMFESVEEMLTSPDYDKDLQSDLTAACPNYMTVFLTAKRDLLTKDFGIVVTGETSAGKTTLINQLVKQKVFVTSNIAATGTITRIRNSEKMEIKCYTKDETLMKEEEIKDVKKLRSLIKALTDIRKIPEDLKDIYYVDVYLPVSILKGNIIIVDTPGIGENERLDNILLDFLPHAVSFVVIINAKNAGGIHENRLSKIMKTIMNNRNKMPCFDPREVIFLTNQWDIIDNDQVSSDEDHESDLDQHKQTWNFIQSKLKKAWGYLNVENVFRISLKQVEKGVDSFFTEEYKRFEIVLRKAIYNNENKRVDFYYRFVKDFIGKAERGTLARLHLLKRSEDEQRRIIGQTYTKITALELKCKQSRKELKRFKTKIISKLAEILHGYLHSSLGREEILNPPDAIKISNVMFTSPEEKVESRIKCGMQRICEKREVKSIIEEADTKIRSIVKDIELQLQNLETEISEIDTITTGFASIGLGIGLGLLFLPPSNVFTWNFHSLHAPSDLFWLRLMGANAIHRCLRKMTIFEVESCLQKAFGVEYDKVIVRIFDEALPKVIESLLTKNKRRFDVQKAVKQKPQSFLRLEEKIKEIQIATEHFERFNF